MELFKNETTRINQKLSEKVGLNDIDTLLENEHGHFENFQEGIENWTISTDENGGVRLNIFIDGKHYTISVHNKDVARMNIILRMRERLYSSNI